MRPGPDVRKGAVDAPATSYAYSPDGLGVHPDTAGRSFATVRVALSSSRRAGTSVRIAVEEASRGRRTMPQTAWSVARNALRRRCGADATLCAHPFGQMHEAIDYQIACRIGYRIGWPGWSPFIGAIDEAGPEPRTPRGVEVEVVACHHHDRAGFELKKFGCLLVGFRARLVYP